MRNLCKAPYICNLADHCRVTELSSKHKALQASITLYSSWSNCTLECSNLRPPELLRLFVKVEPRLCSVIMHLQGHSVQLFLWHTPPLSWHPLAPPRSCCTNNSLVYPWFRVGRAPCRQMPSSHILDDCRPKASSACMPYDNHEHGLDACSCLPSSRSKVCKVSHAMQKNNRNANAE